MDIFNGENSNVGSKTNELYIISIESETFDIRSLNVDKHETMVHNPDT